MITRTIIVDGSHRTVETETHYRISKGITVWLVVDGKDVPIIVEKDMVYGVEDVKDEYASEYHFILPWPNKKNATWLIAKKDTVNEFKR